MADLQIIETKVEPVTDKHRTPWLKQWTKLKVVIPENWAEFYAQRISEVLDAEHPWYADFENDSTHYIIFYLRVFMVDKSQPDDYQQVKEHGLQQGIPDYQLDFGK